jgi:hypothetical protein
MLKVCRVVSEGKAPVVEGAKALEKSCASARTQLARAVADLEARAHMQSGAPQGLSQASETEASEDLISNLLALLSDADMVLENAGDCLERWQEWGLSALEFSSVIRMWSLCALSELQRVASG